jgi:hypothetical protein
MHAYRRRHALLHVYYFINVHIHGRIPLKPFTLSPGSRFYSRVEREIAVFGGVKVPFRALRNQPYFGEGVGLKATVLFPACPPLALPVFSSNH